MQRINILMRLDELNEAAYHGRNDQLEKLLDAVARVMPFVGYEGSGADELKEELDAAFHEVTGQNWYEWKKDDNV